MSPAVSILESEQPFLAPSTLINRWCTQASTIVALALGIAGVTLLAFATGSTIAFYVAALCFGAYYGTTNVMLPIFTHKSFGDRDYAQIYSRVTMAASISNAAAVFISA